MDVINVSLAKIKPYEKNAKKHPDEQVEQIANSIKEFGWQQPLVLDRDNVIVIGHGRYLAAQKLGLDDVPCVYADELTEQQIKALRLADNKTNESAWDFAFLNDELDELFDIDMSKFGFAHLNIDTFFDDEDYSTIAETNNETYKIICLCKDVEQKEQLREFLKEKNIDYKE